MMRFGIVLATLAVLCGVACAAGRRPNLVVFLSDDLGLLDSTPYRATDVRTPNMQRLAADGLTWFPRPRRLPGRFPCHLRSPPDNQNP